jgi:hypothetical protein
MPAIKLEKRRKKMTAQYYIKYSTALSDIRKAAKRVGLQFKRVNKCVNGIAVYAFFDKRRGEVVLENTLWTAYENVCSGFIASFDPESGRFSGVNHYA